METQATNAYRAAQERVDRQIRQIQTLLQAHAKKQTTWPSRYTFAGDLGHITEVLDDAIEFLGGTRETAT